MKWKEILRKDKYALLQSESDTQYAVVSGYDPTQPEDKQWSHGIYFCYWGDKGNQPNYLQTALELFRCKTESDYIPRCRLEELATLFKDGLISDDRESAFEYFDECCEEDSPIANTKFENPMYNKGYDDGFSDGANSVEEE